MGESVFLRGSQTTNSQGHILVVQEDFGLTHLSGGTSSPKKIKVLRTKVIKNGRLEMLAVMGV